MSDVKSRKFLLRLVLLVVIPAAAIVAGGYFYLIGGRYISTENAYVKADIIQMSSMLDGMVTDVTVRDHTRVNAGDLLFRLDPVPFELAVAKAEAELASARTQIETLRAAYFEAKSEMGEMEANIAYLERQAERHQKLRERGITSHDFLDRAESDLAVAREQRLAGMSRMRRALTALVGDPEIPAEEHPLFKEKLADLREAQFNLERSVVVAPSSGIITNMRLQRGEYVEEGRPVFSLITTENSWVEANLKETDLTHIKVGQEATITVDAYPDRKFKARVASISPATGAEFAVLPPQNATGNWVKVVQRLPVKLELQEIAEADSPLRAGMTVAVTIDTKHKRNALVALERTLDGSAHAAD